MGVEVAGYYEWYAESVITKERDYGKLIITGLSLPTQIANSDRQRIEE